MSGARPTGLGLNEADLARSHTLSSVTDGPHAVEVTAFDRDGNEKSDAVIFTVDTSPPNVSIVSPGSDAVLVSPDVVVAWAADDATSGLVRIEVVLDGSVPVSLPGTATVHTFVSLTDGRHTVTVTAVDRAGHERGVAVSFTVQIATTPPDPSGFLVASALGTMGAIAVAAVLLHLRRKRWPPRSELP